MNEVTRSIGFMALVALLCASCSAATANPSGACTSLQRCADPGTFCDLPAGRCGDATASGACVARPQACTREYKPVCGCDGRTYGNDCERRANGAQLDHAGACAGSLER